MAVRMRAALAFALIAALSVLVMADEHVLYKPEGEPVETPELPWPEKAPERPAGIPKEQDWFFWNAQDGVTQWTDPNLVHYDENGEESYTDAKGNPVTERPVEAAWSSLWDEGYQHEFFFNEITNETKWEVPYLFSWNKVHVDEQGAVVEPADDEFEEEHFEEGEFEEGEEGWNDAEHSIGDHIPQDGENAFEEEAEDLILQEGEGARDAEL